MSMTTEIGPGTTEKYDTYDIETSDGRLAAESAKVGLRAFIPGHISHIIVKCMHGAMTSARMLIVLLVNLFPLKV